MVQFEKYQDFYNTFKVLCGRSFQKVSGCFFSLYSSYNFVRSDIKSVGNQACQNARFQALRYDAKRTCSGIYVWTW